MASSSSNCACPDEPALQLTLTNDRAAFETARQAVLGLLGPLQMDPAVLYGVELILEETLMNVIWHAYTDDGEHLIELGVKVDAQDVVMHFADDGRHFDPLQAVQAPPPSSIGDAVPGGLGLKLVKEYARSVTYDRNGGRNELTIRVARR